MTRFKLIAWLAVPALLLSAPALPTAAAASPQPETIEGGADLLYRPFGAMGKIQKATPANASASQVAGEVAIVQHGLEDQLVARNNGILALRFDPPFAAPYTISKVSFKYQVPNGTCDPFYGCILGAPQAVAGAAIGATSWVGPANALGLNTNAELSARAGASLASRTQGYGNFVLPEYNPSVATAANITGITVQLIGVTVPQGNKSGSVTANLRSLRAFNVAECFTSSGSPVVTTNTANGFANVLVGMLVAGPGVPAGASVLSKDSDVQVTLSANANATFPGVTLGFSIPTRTKAAQAVTVGQASASYTLGGPGDTWGWNWLASDFSDLNFRLELVGGTTGTVSFSTGGCNTNSGSTAVTAKVGFLDAKVGMTVTGTGVPSGTTVLATDPGNLQITLSNNASSSGSGRTLTFQRNVPLCNAVAASPTLNTNTPDGFADVTPGMGVAGPGILPGTRVLSKQSNQSLQLTIATQGFISDQTIAFTFGVTRCAMTSGLPVVYTERPFTGAAVGMGIAAAAGSAGLQANTAIVAVAADSASVTLDRTANATGQHQILTSLDQTVIRVDAIRFTLHYEEAGTMAPATVTAPTDWEGPANATPTSFVFPANGTFARARFEPGSPSTRQIYRNLFGTDPDLYGPGKEITGVQVSFFGARRFAGDPTGSLTVTLRSRRAGGPSTTQVVPVTGTLANYVIGGPSNLLGQSWTQADFTNGNLRVELNGSSGAASTSFEVDAFYVTVFYVTKGYLQSVRLTGMTPDELPDLANTLYYSGDHRLERPALVGGAPAMGTAEIPLGLTVTEPDKTFFLVLQFPSFPASADSFPFLATDRAFMDKGLYATSYVVRPQSIRAIDCVTTGGSAVVTTAADAFASVAPGMFVNGPGVPLNTTVLSVESSTSLTLSANATADGTRLNLLFDVPLTTQPVLGAVSGKGLFADQNLVGSMTCELGAGTVPLNAPANLGLNVSAAEARWGYSTDASTLADGTAAPPNALAGVELVSRGTTWGAVATGEASATTLPSVPGSGMQIWGVRSIDGAGRRSVVSNVTISGSTSVGGYAAIAEDADEPNGLASRDPGEADFLTGPTTNRSATIWPAGDLDNYWLFASSNQVVTARATPTGLDFRNDLAPVVQILDKHGDVVASGAAAPGGAAEAMYTVPLKKNGKVDVVPFFVQFRDLSGSPMDPTTTPRVLVPASYDFTVTVGAPSATAQLGQDEAVVAALRDPDAFAFANTGANPVRGQANFGFVIPRSATGGVAVKVRVHDVNGRVMSTLVNENKTPGTYYVSWAGRNADGGRVGSGLYFAKIEAGTWSRTVRVNLMR